jgi:hypothetical protein
VTATDHAALIEGLAPRHRRVLDVIAERGPLTDLELRDALGHNGDASGPRTRRNELCKMGLVRQAKPGRRGGKALWEATPADQVEALREAAERTPPRVRAVETHDLGTRVEAFRKLLADPEVQEEIENPDGAATKREKRKLKAAMERELRDRKRELREAEQAKHPALTAIQLREALRSADDKIHALTTVLDEERERRTLFGESPVVDEEWRRCIRHSETLERHVDVFVEAALRIIGEPSRREADVEYADDEIEEAEFSDAESDLIEKLGGSARLALPPGKE